jgi:Delta7-sterol 5-desaturase
MLCLFLHILGYDLWFYMSHRFLHHPSLWWIHKEHHLYVNPKWYDAYSGHPLESILQSVGTLLPFAFGLWSPWETGLALVLINARGMARHDSRSAWIDSGHHLLHHRFPTKNYGEPWLDWLFGTT